MPPKKQIQTSVDEEFLKFVASKYSITLPEAVRKIDECIKKTALGLNLSYATVYASLFPKERNVTIINSAAPSVIASPPKAVSGTVLISNNVCSALVIQECNASENCFNLEPYGCLDKKIPDADEINQDPDKYILKHLTKLPDLERMVKIAAYLYYNYEGGGLTDNSYDALEYHLKSKLKIKGRLYEKIGALPVDKIRKRLRFQMPSLDKIKPGTNECSRFLSQFLGSAFIKPIPCAWSLKLDGVSGCLIYENGKLVEINTRGDGVTGGDVTYLKDYILSIPKELKSTAHDIFVVRGEFILPKDKWESKYKESYSNARALVSGKINSGFISPALNDIDFVAYEIMYEKLKNAPDDKNTVPQPSHAFKILDIEGFLVVENEVLHSPTVFEIMELYKSKRLSSKYYIDGLVLSLDKSRKGSLEVDEHTTIAEKQIYSMAFKMPLEDQMRQTKVINVEWNISRLGRYVPKAIYEAVYVDGSRLTKALAFNARWVLNKNLGKGTQITILRSGDVIPVIKNPIVDAKIEPIFPPTAENGGYDYHWEGIDIVLDDIETNRDVKIKRSIHFFETIGVSRLGPKTIEKLYEAGMELPEDIVNATVADFMKIKNIGKKSAEGFYDGIRKTLSKTPPDRFIVASSVFKSGMGTLLLKQIFKEIPTLLDMNTEQIYAYFKNKKVAGFGAARIKITAEGIPHFKKYLDGFAKEYVKEALSFYAKRMKHLDEKGRNELIKGKFFAKTNFMSKTDCELADYMFDHEGTFTETVSKKVSAVICAHMNSITEKMIAAAELEIPILTLEEFCERFNVPLKKFQKDKNKTQDEEEED